MWQPQRLTTLWASMACYRDSFNVYLLWNFINYLNLIKTAWDVLRKLPFCVLGHISRLLFLEMECSDSMGINLGWMNSWTPNINNICPTFQTPVRHKLVQTYRHMVFQNHFFIIRGDKNVYIHQLLWLVTVMIIIASHVHYVHRKVKTEWTNFKAQSCVTFHNILVF
jgi:hypothetical protein